MLVLGNSKLSHKIAIFNLPPGRTCPNCADCYATCYAKKFYRMYPNVKAAWDFNLEQTKRPDFDRIMSDEIRSLASKLIAIRLHGAGDFYNPVYFARWQKIARGFPKTLFYSYTKVWACWDRWKREGPENLNLICSFIDGFLNYGNEAYCQKLVRDHGAFLCPTGHDKSLVCGEDCTYCFKKQKPCFIQH